ncbi:MAG: hypothetical protein U1E46_18325 [Hyphomicrobiales bacterium]
MSYLLEDLVTAWDRVRDDPTQVVEAEERVKRAPSPSFDEIAVKLVLYREEAYEQGRDADAIRLTEMLRYFAAKELSPLAREALSKYMVGQC